MMDDTKLAVLSLLAVCVTCCLANPEQIHLSYGVDASRMVVTWSTQNATQNAMCLYGKDWSLAAKATGSTTKFSEGHTQYIHRVTLVHLQPGTIYFYRCGNENQLSSEYYFKSKRTDPDWSPTLALFGDMGMTNAQSLTRLINDTRSGMYDAIFHVGDFAYDFVTNNGHVGDGFMNNIQPIAAYVPYMTCPGNHEQHFNFSNYRNRFTMPTDERGDRMYYSFDMGPMHVISFNTEYLFFLQYGFMQIVEQYRWLDEDLQKATRNRAKTPWIMTMGHRPMYCSNKDRDDCTHHESMVRTGLPFLHTYSLERLFRKYDVDIMFWAHEHSYERLWPVYDRQVFNGTKSPYNNPKAPVHIITGSAGCNEIHDRFANSAPWSAFRSDDYGYTRMKVYNSTHLYTEQVSDDKNGAIIDKMWYVKEYHLHP